MFFNKLFSPLHNYILMILPRIQVWYERTLINVGLIQKHRLSNELTILSRMFQLWNKPVVNLHSPTYIAYLNKKGSQTFWSPYNDLDYFNSKLSSSQINEILTKYKLTHEDGLMTISKSLITAKMSIVEILDNAMLELNTFSATNKVDYNFVK